MLITPQHIKEKSKGTLMTFPNERKRKDLAIQPLFKNLNFFKKQNSISAYMKKFRP